MGLVDQLVGKNIYLDTAPIIYYIDGNKEYDRFVNNLFLLNQDGKVQFLSSTLTLLELLVLPLRRNRADLVAQYETIITNSDHIQLINLDAKISRKAAEIRAMYNYKTPDSIQIATALISNSEIFLTNDKKLKQNEIETIVLNELR